MAIKMVREPSETPNINNIDDIVPMRYAYGNQNGYVIGKGNEISNTVNGLNFTVNSGRLVLQGIECDIDATGVTITIDNIATKRYYTIYLEVNLGLNTATIKSEYDTATYPTIDTGDDLTENTTGIARLPLYRFVATSGVISEVNKVVESIKYTSDMSVANANTVQNVDFSSDSPATFGYYTIQKYVTLWEGSIHLSTTSSEDYIDISVNLPNNAILEITYNSIGGGLAGRGNSQKFIITNKESSLTYSATILITRGSRLVSCDIGIFNNTFRLWKPYYILNKQEIGTSVYITSIRQII